MGDVNADGSVDTTDSSMVMQYSVGKIELDDDAWIRADFNTDGKANTSDASLILKASVGKALLSQDSNLATMGNVSAEQIGTDSVDWTVILPEGGTITWDDLDWSLLDMEAIDWDSFTMEELFRILLGTTSANPTI